MPLGPSRSRGCDLTRDGWDADRDGGAREAEHLHRLAHALGPTRASRPTTSLISNGPPRRDRPRRCVGRVGGRTRQPTRASRHDVDRDQPRRAGDPRPQGREADAAEADHATVAPGHTFAVWIEAPTPVETPQPSRQARERARASGIGTICPARHHGVGRQGAAVQNAGEHLPTRAMEAPRLVQLMSASAWRTSQALSTARTAPPR